MSATLAARIRDLRIRYFGKQIVLAVYCGVTHIAVSHWENGDRVPDHPARERLIAALRQEGAPAAEIERLARQARRALARARNRQQDSRNTIGRRRRPPQHPAPHAPTPRSRDRQGATSSDAAKPRAHAPGGTA